MNNNKGITIVSPMWGDLIVTNRMVFSVIHQYIPKNDPFNIHLVLVDDYLEKRGEDNSSPYDYYLSNEFKNFYDTEHIKISLIKNDEHKYQGESREIGFMHGDYEYFIMVDCDDILSPNTCEKYLYTIYDSIEEYKKESIIMTPACIYGMTFGFGENGNENPIDGTSIWVQGRCYNRDFIKKHDIHFLTGINSKQGEDYPFIRKFDYALNHDDDYYAISLSQDSKGNKKYIAPTVFWYPNDESLSRRDPHYGQHLSGWTAQSSNSVLDFFEEFNKKNDFVDEEDEFMKHEFLNMTIYTYFNILDFLKEVASTDYEPLEEDWYAIRDNCKKLRQRLLDKYYGEIVYSDIEDMLYNVRHNSDCHKVESWLGTFYDYMDTELDFLNYSYDEMIQYCNDLEFDGVGHEIHSPQVIAWDKRHNTTKEDK